MTQVGFSSAKGHLSRRFSAYARSSSHSGAEVLRAVVEVPAVDPDHLLDRLPLPRDPALGRGHPAAPAPGSVESAVRLGGTRTASAERAVSADDDAQDDREPCPRAPRLEPLTREERQRPHPLESAEEEPRLDDPGSPPLPDEEEERQRERHGDQRQVPRAEEMRRQDQGRKDDRQGSQDALHVAGRRSRLTGPEDDADHARAQRSRFHLAARLLQNLPNRKTQRATTRKPLPGRPRGLGEGRSGRNPIRNPGLRYGFSLRKGS